MTENTRKQFTDHAIEQSNTVHPYCLICGTSVEKHPVLLMSDEEIENELWDDSNPENYDGCANQELIAAPDETTKCREHQEKVISNDEHYAGMRKFFDENLKDLEFNSYLPYCSQCGKKDPVYVGMMRAFGRHFPLTFAFCVNCHDDLVRRADAAKQSPERFGV